MKSVIRVLDEITINQIAAGEVIENPSSVVKELVENSIDAGSTEITIEIKGGGRQLIRISDNGCGMCQDDALLCLERHATSKIHNLEELHETLTMGFRGEAVPSIASISKFSILTNSEEAPEKGTMVVVEGGKILKVSQAPREKGTTIEVKSLFYNVPVRRKFQKSPTHDASEIQKMIVLLALANPSINFQYINNEERVFFTTTQQGTPEASHKHRIDQLLGYEYLEHSLWIECSHSIGKICGWVGAPHDHKQNRSGQYVFINKRSVSAPFVSYALKDAYSTLLPPRRHPTFILFLEIAPDSVDVNVHPQKREVRLRREGELRELLHHAACEALKTHPLRETPEFVIEPCFQRPLPSFNLEEFVLREPPLSLEPAPQPMIPRDVEPFKTVQIPLPLPEKTQEKPAPKVLAVLPGYIVVDTSSIDWFEGKMGGLSLVDQNAAHNRVLFEKFVSTQPEQLQIQELLIPHNFTLTAKESEILIPLIETLQKEGIGIKEFGGGSFVVDALPTILGDIDVKSLILDLIHDLNEMGEYTRDSSFMKERIARLLSSAAARASVSKSTLLSHEEAQNLLKELFKCKNPHISSIGLPTVARFSEEDIAKQFRK